MPRKEASANPGCPMVYHITNKTKALLRLCFFYFILKMKTKTFLKGEKTNGNRWNFMCSTGNG